MNTTSNRIENVNKSKIQYNSKHNLNVGNIDDLSAVDPSQTLRFFKKNNNIKKNKFSKLKKILNEKQNRKNLFFNIKKLLTSKEVSNALENPSEIAFYLGAILNQSKAIRDSKIVDNSLILMNKLRTTWVRH